mgnify:CR=1 FL=1
MRTLYLISIFFSLFFNDINLLVDNVIKSYDENKYFLTVKDIMYRELKENMLSINTISNRSTDCSNMNMLLIPQFILEIDTIGLVTNLFFDSINPINRAILFNKNDYVGSLLFNAFNDTLFCPKRITGLTHFDCIKYIYLEKKYNNILKHLVKKRPMLIFKCSNIERCWFYVDKSRNICVYTYDEEFYYFEDFIKIKDFSKYSALLKHQRIK